MQIDALAFDTGGTILDWHGGLSAAFAGIGEQCGLTADWPAVTNAWRRLALRRMTGGPPDARPVFNIDAVHRQTLDQVLAEHDLNAIGVDDRDTLAGGWHGLSPWPDVVEGLARMRKRYVVASFTILSTSLIIDVSRRAGLNWDCIISCEMIGTYKPRPLAYQTAARWLALPPERILMVACHNNDLLASRAVGFRTAFVHRPREWGPVPPPDPVPNPAVDLVANDFLDLADKLGAQL